MACKNGTRGLKSFWSWARVGSMVLATAGAWVGLSVASVPYGLQPADKGAPPARTTVFAIDHADLDHFLVDPRDAGLKAALKMIPARLRELPGEIPEFGRIPQGVFDLIAKLQGRAARLGVSYDGKNQDKSFFGAGLIASIGANDEKDAGEIHALITGLLNGIGDDLPPIAASKEYPSMSELPTPAGSVRFGPRRSADGWRYEIHLGTGDPEGVFKELTTISIPGSKTFLRAFFDGFPLTPLLAMLADAAGGQGDDVLKQLQDGGLIGPDAVRYQFAVAHTDTGVSSVTRAVGMGKHAAAAGGKLYLAADDLRLLPADTTMGSLSKFSIAPMIAELDKAADASPEVRQFMDGFRKELGFDLVQDVLRSIGDVAAAYLSDSTGGGTLGSGVFVLGLKDSAKFTAAHEKFTTRLNAELAKRRAANGYVRIKSWMHDGVRFHSVQFPGLPVPLEPTYCIGDKHLVVGLTPQAAIAAVRQSAGKGDGGLMSGPAAGSFPKRQFTSISYSDTRRFVSTGYPIVSLMGSALANAVRSRTGDRDPGVIVPVYAELAKGVRPAVSFGYWDNDDYVTESSGDRSLLVNLASGFGAISEFAPVIVAATAAIGAANAQRSARMIEPPQPAPDGRRRPNFMVIPAQPAGHEPDLDLTEPRDSASHPRP